MKGPLTNEARAKAEHQQKIAVAIDQALKLFANLRLTPNDARQATTNMLAQLIGTYSTTVEVAIKNADAELGRVKNLITNNWPVIEASRKEQG
jgi:hypothetical protein